MLPHILSPHNPSAVYITISLTLLLARKGGITPEEKKKRTEAWLREIAPRPEAASLYAGSRNLLSVFYLMSHVMSSSGSDPISPPWLHFLVQKCLTTKKHPSLFQFGGEGGDPVLVGGRAGRAHRHSQHRLPLRPHRLHCRLEVEGQGQGRKMAPRLPGFLNAFPFMQKGLIV